MSELILTFYELANSTSSVSEQFATARKLYEVGNIKNKIHDGTLPFPEDASQISSGVAVEFRCVYAIRRRPALKIRDVVSRNVSFKYPGAENYALRNISFTLCPGQLCVCPHRRLFEVTNP